MASNNCDSKESKNLEKEQDFDPNWLKGTSAEKLVNCSSTNKSSFSHPVYKKLSKLNGKVNSMSMNELKNALNELELENKLEKI